MKADLHALLVDLVEGVPALAGGPEDGVAVAVHGLDVVAPLEVSATGGRIAACAARARLATGFDVPLARVRARFVTEPVQ